MAVGDAVAVFLGTGTVNRQPAAGVEEQISCIVKEATTDPITIFDGTTAIEIFAGGVSTSNTSATAASEGAKAYNMALMITNAVFLRKEGTTDQVYVGGVQTNA